MEKTERRVEGTKLRSGRVALGEIGNLARRPPPARHQVKCLKRGGDRSGCEPTSKRTHDGVGGKIYKDKRRCHEETGERVTQQLGSNGAACLEKENVCQGGETAYEFESKCKVSGGEDPERTISCERNKRNKPAADAEVPKDCFLHYEQDICRYLMTSEREQILMPDHLRGRTITGKMRQVVIDWLLEVQSHFRLCQETVELTVALMDRCLAMDLSVNQDNVQLVCLASMFIAIKYEETFLLELSDLRYICDYTYKEEEIVQMEKKILRMLDFKLSYILRSNFVGIYLRSLEKSQALKRLVRYYVDLSLVDYKLASVEPSRVTSACLYMALCVLHRSARHSLPDFISYSILDIRCVVLVLASRAITNLQIEKGGVFSKHLRDLKPGSLRDVFRSDDYTRTLRQICSVFSKIPLQ